MLNKILLIGRLGKDPELRELPSGAAVANFTLATSEKRKGQDGLYSEHTEWHSVVAFAKLAKLAHEFLNKGKKAYIEGKISTRKWQDKEGNDRYTTEIIASTILFLSEKNEGFDEPSKSYSQSFEASPQSVSVPPIAFDDDDIPF